MSQGQTVIEGWLADSVEAEFRNAVRCFRVTAVRRDLRGRMKVRNCLKDRLEKTIEVMEIPKEDKVSQVCEATQAKMTGFWWVGKLQLAE